MGTRVDEALAAYEREWRGVAGCPTPMPSWLRSGFDQQAERYRVALRHAVIMEGANVPCELVRDGGG